jgi:hypothetical protein
LNSGKSFYPLSCFVMVMLALPLHTCTSGPVALRAMCLRGDDRHQLLLNNVFGYIGNLRNWLPWMAAATPVIHGRVAWALWMAGLQALIACEQTGQVLICVLELSFTMNDSGPSASAVICSRMDHVTRCGVCRLRRSRRKSPTNMRQCFVPILCTPSLSFSAAQLIGERQTGQSVPLFFGWASMPTKTYLLMEELRAPSHIQVDLLPTAGEYPQVTALMADIALAS